MEWKDTTSYSRGDKEREPKTFSATCGPLKLTVTKGHIYYPGKWVAHAYPLFDTHPLDVETLGQAQDAVVQMARKWLEAASAALSA